MKAVSKRLKVGEQIDKKEQFYSDVDDKIKAFKELKTYCEKFIQINDIEAFTNDVIGYFLDEFDKQVNDLPRSISLEKRLELMDVEMHKLQALFNKFELFTHIELNYLTMEVLNTPDFSIYIEGDDKINKWNKLTDLINLLNELKELGVQSYPVPLSQAMNRTVIFDFNNNCLKPNLGWIEGNSRFF